MAEYWYLWLVLAALIIVTAVVIFFAARAASSHNAQTKKLLEELKHLKQLKDKYKVLTPELVNSSEPSELLEGVNAVMQAKLEKSDSPEQTFAEFNEVQKNLYTLYYFLEDSTQGLSFFFKNNGAELREQIMPALEAVKENDFSPFVKRAYDMFDENNEEVSLGQTELNQIDSQFLSIFNTDKLLTDIKSYISDNLQSLND